MSSSTQTFKAPFDGVVMPLTQVPDPVFAGLSLGEGVALDPLGECLHAPCDGEVVQCARTHHAITLRTPDGIELLLHLGIDTVNLEGEGIEPLVAVGDRVSAGAPLCRFDADRVARGASALITPLIVTESAGWRLRPLAMAAGTLVSRGEALMVLERDATETLTSNPVTSNEPTGPQHERHLVLALEAGLHARPASRLRAIAREHGVAMHLHTAAGEASSESLSALMNLGLTAGSAFILVVRGEGAEQALDAAESLLTTPEGGDHAQSAAGPARMASAEQLAEGDLAGLVASPGLAMGPLVAYRAPLPEVAKEGEGEPVEWPRLNSALVRVAEALARDEEDALRHDQAAEAEIFSAHRAWLEDPDLAAAARQHIHQGRSAGQAWREALDAEAERLLASGITVLAGRVADLRDLQRRVMIELAPGNASMDAPELPTDAILLAEDLTPSELVALVASRPAGLCLVGGGTTSHVAILARARGIPCLVAMGAPLEALARECTSDTSRRAVLDGDIGRLEVAPDETRLVEVAATLEANRQRAESERSAAHSPAKTRDGRHIEVCANIGNGQEASHAVDEGADGVGLMRSEFLFLERQEAPDETSQREQYQMALDGMGGKPVIIRTLDIGADKQLTYLRMMQVPNPALGVRGVRLWQTEPQLLDTQLRALLGVTPLEALRIMLPMVTEVAELRQVRQRIEAIAGELGLAQRPQLGVMIEVPAAALCAASLAQEADFFSIGTNDLTQYTLAMDREDPSLAARADVLHPAVLRLIHATVEGAAGHCPVGVCGTSAGDPLAAPVLVALGVNELSTEPARIPAIKAALRRLDAAALAHHMPELLAMDDAMAVRERVADILAQANSSQQHSQQRIAS
ncbi:phosphoenolpyruvate--protein phosphotransferase [Halomonas urumqiensis]|uniref:phosphoenolpyruvate--protein phosphotransferase n=1 Tax=Halomonas urumqiensis TaxID=1684789 RepID=A0A2N7UDM6_9GAMM|nr:phosphoenolpyruvate--protein phosphotransferase [Halomonas urumqiensis]PMR78566.1 phosphoenolpyruvate--protein phosphotransferase [Halomonas urumqiensis]PTB03710.1 phosphoenolpyruvate--protein phosphotransferase [Halomonas urumqiensis]GHE20071.1 phosphoenolpyruvate--protein phosphotransferase [Halomonas urumqiensis]